MILPAHVPGRVGLGHRDEDVALAVVDDVHPVARGGLHRDEAQDLQEMVLHDVAHRPDRVVEVPAVGDVEVLSHRDLHGGDEVPVPDRLEDRVREAEVEDVLDGHLPEEVVDAVELGLVDVRVQLGVQRARRREVVAERLLDDDARVGRHACFGQAADDSPEERGRDLEVEDRELRITDRLRDLGVRVGVGEVAVDVGEPLCEPLEDLLVDLLARRDDRFTSTIDELLERPVVEGDADDGALEEAARLEPVQRAIGHDACEVARDPEDHEHVGRPRPAVRLPVHVQSISASPWTPQPTSGRVDPPPRGDHQTFTGCSLGECLREQ